MLDPGVKDGLCDPDEIPLPPDEAITQPGDLWLLGDHRLLCGDSASVADVNRLLTFDVQKCNVIARTDHDRCEILPVHLVNTDPPYNEGVELRSNNAIAAGLSSFGTPDALTLHHGFDSAHRPSQPG